MAISVLGRNRDRKEDKKEDAVPGNSFPRREAS